MRVSSFLQEESDCILHAVLHAQVESSVGVPIGVVYRCSSDDQARGRFEITCKQKVHQDGDAFRVLLVQVLSPERQVLDYLTVVVCGSKHYWGLAKRVLHLELRVIILHHVLEEFVLLLLDANEYRAKVFLLRSSCVEGLRAGFD